MDESPAASHPCGAHFVRPKRTASRLVNPLREFDLHRADNKKGHPDGAAFFYWWRWREWMSRLRRLTPAGRTSCVPNGLCRVW